MKYAAIKHLAAALCAIASLAGAQTASAAFKIRVDNLSNPAGKTSWGTTDTIIVLVFFNNGSSVALDLPNTSALTETRDLTVSGNWSDVAYFQLGIFGDDMFGIDQVEIISSTGSVLRTWGLDNQSAWCLSEDPDDGNSGPECGNNPSEFYAQFNR